VRSRGRVCRSPALEALERSHESETSRFVVEPCGFGCCRLRSSERDVGHGQGSVDKSHESSRGNRSHLKPGKDSTPADATQNEDPPCVSKSNLRRRWANLIRRVYCADPLICPKCGSKVRILSFITQPRVINKILEHLKNRATQTRGPPTPKLQQAPLPLSLMCSST
jgi:hypothetical protein